ncbi:NAD-dependent epimerase/dehydratase family protein [Streptomyces sp. NPDC003077]|uniref:NAD-dependent epimerase/dehydratase family protein n=1 Tax=Streptomyces sp. NPDC003077 TaxID=3154443 RepID=UPI0033BCAE72
MASDQEQGERAASPPGGGLRVVVTGATGNLGTALLRRLDADERIASVVGIARRVPGDPGASAKTEWVSADTTRSDLAALFEGADAVVHLAWLFHPTRRPKVTWETNVGGSARVFEAVAAAKVPALVHVSSVGAYSPGPKDVGVSESWPTDGWPEAAYCREKAYVERLLDVFERDHSGTRVVRMRPGIVLQRDSAAEQRRIFLGPFVPTKLVRPDRLPIPDLPGLRFQTVHADDVADALRAALVRSVSGPFNLAAAPVVDAAMLADVFGTRTIRVPRGPVRAALSAAWALHAVPVPLGMFDAVLRFPVMDTTRAESELAFRPRSARETITEFALALQEDAGGPTPRLASPLPGGRVAEAATGMGRRT